MSLLRNLLAAVIATLIVAPAALAQAPAAAGPQQFLYVLKLAPRLHDEAKWTDKDRAATARHFERLKKITAEGSVILAGRTTESMDKTFGLVVFEAENEAAAKAFMEADPAVMEGVMTATLHPYRVSLQRK